MQFLTNPLTCQLCEHCKKYPRMRLYHCALLFYTTYHGIGLIVFFLLSLQSSAVEQVLDILMDILSWEIVEVVSSCLPRGLWPHIVIRVFLLLGTVCPRHPPYPVLLSCPLSRAFPYPQPGDAGGRHSAPAVYQSLTSADPTTQSVSRVEYRDGLHVLTRWWRRRQVACSGRSWQRREVVMAWTCP